MHGKRALKFACIATLLFSFAEFIGGSLAHSLALIGDAAHLLTDAGALGVAFFAAWIAAQPATRKMSYGFHRVEILAALINGVGLVTIAIFLVRAALYRLKTPVPVHTPLMLAMGVVGLLFNLGVAFFLHRFSKENLNVRSAFFHVLADLLGSVGVVTAGIVIWMTGWIYADPLASMGIALLIVWGAWKILRDVVEVLLEAAPSRVDIVRLESRLLSLSGVEEICDLHVWTIASGKEALSAHLGLGSGCDPAALLQEVNTLLLREFGISHTTIQLEEAKRKPHKPHDTHGSHGF